MREVDNYYRNRGNRFWRDEQWWNKGSNGKNLSPFLRTASTRFWIRLWCDNANQSFQCFCNVWWERAILSSSFELPTPYKNSRSSIEQRCGAWIVPSSMTEGRKMPLSRSHPSIRYAREGAKLIAIWKSIRPISSLGIVSDVCLSQKVLCQSKRTLNVRTVNEAMVSLTH